MADNEHQIIFKPKPAEPPPPATVGVIGWLRENLFYSWFSTVVTFFCLWIIYSLLAIAFDWGFTKAVWDAQTRRECLDKSPDGACWAGVKVWFSSFIYGRYPVEERWRINTAFLVIVAWLIPLWLKQVKQKISIGITAVLVFPFLAAYLFTGGERSWFSTFMVTLAISVFVLNWIHVVFCITTTKSLREVLVNKLNLAGHHESTHKYPVLGFLALLMVIIWFTVLSSWVPQYVGTDKWGGLFLTLVIAGVGIVFALPGGVILALARRSQMPFIRVMAIAFIELFRSVPLITVLFMAVTMFPLFLPEGTTLDKLVQAMVGVCLFAAAYMAEVVRGGLQAIPRGQYEAAAAMGLSYWKMMNLIILPQALKLMIPNIVGNFIGLLKDTTLVSIIGLYDLLRMLNATGNHPKWIGMHTETLAFGAVIYFVLCFCMSQYSQHLERKLRTGH